jgi:son of sevenless-like protein
LLTQVSLSVTLSFPPPPLPLSPSLLSPLSLLHPLEIARQLTLILSDYYRAIHLSELVDASWMKELKKETASPNLFKLSRFETRVSFLDNPIDYDHINCYFF